MFSNIGWSEIFFLLIIGLIVIGPERLPAVVEDVRAAIYAAKKAINNAKAELNGELEGFDEFKKPLDTVSQYAAMGPRRAMAKVLFEDEAVDGPAPAGPSEPAKSGPRPKTGSTKVTGAKPDDGGRAERPSQSKGFSWEDIT